MNNISYTVAFYPLDEIIVIYENGVQPGIIEPPILPVRLNTLETASPEEQASFSQERDKSHASHWHCTPTDTLSSGDLSLPQKSHIDIGMGDRSSSYVAPTPGSQQNNGQNKGKEIVIEAEVVCEFGHTITIPWKDRPASASGEGNYWCYKCTRTVKITWKGKHIIK